MAAKVRWRCKNSFNRDATRTGSGSFIGCLDRKGSTRRGDALDRFVSFLKERKAERFFEGRFDGGISIGLLRISKVYNFFLQLERSETAGTRGVQRQLRSIGRMHTRFSRGHHLFTSLCVPTNTHDTRMIRQRESGEERNEDGDEGKGEKGLDEGESMSKR